MKDVISNPISDDIHPTSTFLIVRCEAEREVIGMSFVGQSVSPFVTILCPLHIS